MSRAINPSIPLAIATLGIASFAAMDAVMKGLSIALGAYNAMLWRMVAGFLIAALVFAIKRPPWPARSTLAIHLRRGIMGSIMALLFFWGIARVPLAEGTALSFIAPLITLYLAAVLLGEQIGRRAILASLMGLAGVGTMLAGRVGSGSLAGETLWGIAAILTSALFYAYNLILQRQQAQVAGPIEISFFQSGIALAVLLLAAPWLAVVPNAEHFPQIGLAAALAWFSLGVLAWAYARAEAQILVTAEYTAFIWAVLFGWLLFQERVTWVVIFGAALIVLGCLIVARQKPEPVELATI